MAEAPLLQVGRLVFAQVLTHLIETLSPRLARSVTEKCDRFGVYDVFTVAQARGDVI
jgi:hypothetical protein